MQKVKHTKTNRHTNDPIEIATATERIFFFVEKNINNTNIAINIYYYLINKWKRYVLSYTV